MESLKEIRFHGLKEPIKRVVVRQHSLSVKYVKVDVNNSIFKRVGFFKPIQVAPREI